MKSMGWVLMSPSGSRYLWTLAGTTVLVVSDYSGDTGKVWMWTHGSVGAAVSAVTNRIAEIDEAGGLTLVREPFTFDITPGAMTFIRPAPDCLWMRAPHLYAELAAALS